jgi:hypothetical protein
MKMDKPPTLNKESTPLPSLEPNEEIIVDNSENKESEEDIQERFIRVPLTEEELKMSVVDFVKKYGYTYNGAKSTLKRGFRSIVNPNFTSLDNKINETNEKRKKYIKTEITAVPIRSIEAAIGNEKEQEEIKRIVKLYDLFRYRFRYHTGDISKTDLDGKRFKLLNGQELTFGDFVVLDRIIDLKMFRNNDGELMIFDEEKNDFTKFRQTNFFNKKSISNGFVFRKNLIKKDNSKKRQYEMRSLESFAPAIYKLGLFREEDFGVRLAGTNTYDIHGPHERTITKSKPSAALSNSVSRALYYIGRDKFTGTNRKINHESVRVSVLDDTTGVITDVINGKKIILYTFPLIRKEEYETKKKELIERRMTEGKSIDKKSISDNIKKKVLLKEYSLFDYIVKESSESDIDYKNRISRLSDTSYVVGSFRKFMSETGLAANNYSWKEQLILADTLTSVEDKKKIVGFGNNFGKEGIRTFLSVEHGGEKMGDKILTLGNSEKLPEGLAKKIFAKYGEIINIADNIEQEVKNIFGDKDIPSRVLSSVKETLLKRGAKMLSDLGDKVLDPEFKLNEVEVFKELDEIKEETIILGKSYYELYWEGIRVPIEDITTIKETPTRNLTEEQKDKLLKIYEKGRPKVTYESKEHLDFLKKEFKAELNDKDISVNEICFNDETIIIALVDKKDKENLYVGGLTFVDGVKNAVVAEATLSHLVEKFKDKNIRALVDSKNPLLKMYQKRFGFKIIKKLDRENEIKDNGGQIYVEIEKLKEENKEEDLKIAA